MKTIEQTGWLIDLYEDPLGGVRLWLLSDDGQRRLLHQRFPVRFYASGPERALQDLERFLQQRPVPPVVGYVEREDVFARRAVRVLTIEARSPVEQAALFHAVRRRFPDLEYADADIPVSLRYAAATGVSPLCRCRVEVGAYDTVERIKALEDRWVLDPAPLPLRVLALAPDSDPKHAPPRAVRVRYEQKEHCFALEPERALLVNLAALLRQYDPDLLLTAWGDTWLLPQLLAMADRRGIALPLNRDPQAEIFRKQERWYFSYGQIIYKGEQVRLFGRWHIDRHNALFWTDYSLDGVLEMARVTALPVQTAARVSPGTGISAIQMLAALREEILVPWQKQQAEMFKPAADLFAADQGGLVFQPIVGVHRQVAFLDYVSLYPSAIVYFNISPETLGVNVPGAERVPELNLSIDRSRVGIIPLALKPLLDKRVALKRRGNQLPRWDPRKKSDKERSAALKWLLVTCFGYLGYKNARFGRIEAHQAVTAYGREALLEAKEAAEDAGFEVLHAYVDGIWLKGPDESAPEGLDGLVEEIERRTGLPIVVDGIFRWIVFLPSRVNPHRPVANRYFGVFEDGEIKARGIALRRRDTPRFVARVQSELLDCLARVPEKGSPETALPSAEVLVEAEALLRRRLSELRGRRVKLKELLVGQRLSRELEDYRSPSPAARAARQLREVGKVVKPGQQVRFLFTRGDPGVYAWDLLGQPNPAAMAPLDAAVDVARYADLLRRAAGEILEPFGWKKDGNWAFLE